ncbi:ABC-2 type transport system ATP-binding protein [Natronincola peptidivorans]|uniref:ABC-2 type transport system ATP-binding protein n=1 Tax=Natronincola peptidivorans TaxID=426128 RepID=A0A1I0F2M9_9FIRM|nr:ABC transporter ATP-binding protein [Natronincola peptidivorans]SET52051.1 ABC-2 type transport system ATP-binding protein [Natronincola peptidivorans]
MDKILELENVTKEYKNFKLDNISFSLEKGYIMGLVGPNGSGKTTTIKLIMNLLSKNSGEIKVFGLDNSLDEKAIKERIGFVYDDNIYPLGLKLSKIALLIAPFYKTWNQELFNQYMKKFQLDPQSSLEKLSKGMKTKFAIVMALSHKPDLIIMDEPTSGLDPIFRRELLEMLQEIIEDGNCSVLFSSHITSDLEKIADYITFMDKGRVVLSDTYVNIVENYRLVKASEEIIKKERNKFLSYRCNSFGGEGLCKNWHSLQNEYPDKIVLEKPTIEDIMYYISKREEVEC